MATAYLVRHLETESNAKGLFGDGPLDDVAQGQNVQRLQHAVVALLGARLGHDAVPLALLHVVVCH